MNIVHFNAEQLQWMPVLAATSIYTGALIGQDVAVPLEGVMAMTPATGFSNTTAKDYPYGIVVGNNNVSGNILSTAGAGEYITEVAAGSMNGHIVSDGDYPATWTQQ